jgi:SAM-dependent methyltransferase
MNTSESLVLEPTGERMVPESSDLFTFWEHVYRYAFASRFVSGKRVLDIACGEGYGGAALQKAGAAQVIGVDISETVCLHARSKYGLDARLGTAEQIPLAVGSVDVIVSFETIEHVPDPNRFLDECVRVLAPGGRLIISTPDKDIYGRKVQNPYHCSEMTAGEFTEALNTRFLYPRFYTQRPHSAAWWSTRTIVCENPPWGFIRGSRRLRRAVQRWIYPEVVKDPSDEQRRSTVDTILKVAGSGRRPLNPYLLRPRGRWDQEKSVYIIATAVRGSA